ncbi:MAG TPA: hypothetical protein VK731_10065 [Candidatus Cybelea sp.]|nr:hypothetical protein [Candidatus Cybelea sp.]
MTTRSAQVADAGVSAATYGVEEDIGSRAVARQLHKPSLNYVP